MMDDDYDIQLDGNSEINQGHIFNSELDKLLNEIGANAMYDYLCRFIVSKYGPDALYNLLFGAIKKYTSIKWEFLTR